MSDDSPKIYVLSQDYGTEGLAEPFMAFYDKPTAEQAKALCEGSGYQRLRLSEVPLWKR